MKREAINHTKMRRLARILGIEPWGARGIMESVWHVTGEEAPAGDIGKLSDEDIADAIGWHGDAGTLVNGLVEARWIDKTPTYRLAIHDWPDHCSDHIHAKMAKARMRFANGSVPKFSKLTERERKAAESINPAEFKMPAPVLSGDCVGIPTNSQEVAGIPENSQESRKNSQESYPTLPYPTLPDPTTPNQQRVREMPKRGPSPSDHFEKVWSRWPRQTGKDAACRDWIDVVNTDNESDALACVDRYLASEEVARGVVRNLGTVMSGGAVKTGWLVDCAKDGWTCNWPQARGSKERAIPLPPSPSPPSRDEEIRAMRDLLESAHETEDMKIVWRQKLIEMGVRV